MTNTKFLAAFALVAALSSGCATTARYVTAEHWHDNDTFFIGYTEYVEHNYIVTKTGDSTAHVMMCRAQADNTAQCRPQVAVDRLLNPDEKFEDPPPPAEAPSAPPVESEPAAEGAPAS